MVSQYLRFQMVDEKTILEQIHELQVISNKLKGLSIDIPEIFQVGVERFFKMYDAYIRRLFFGRSAETHLD